MITRYDDISFIIFFNMVVMNQVGAKQHHNTTSKPLNKDINWNASDPTKLHI